MSVIALMTDFGTRDYYVAAMKGVILQLNPRVTILDISHEISAQDLYHGAYVLRQSLPYFPTETIFVAVIDPTVGSRRRILAARYSDRVVLAPDNGLLTLLQRDAELQEIRTVENRRFFASTVSSTFHGRDIFAPVAAHLSLGVPLADLGPIATQIEVLEIAKPRRNQDGSIEGQVTLVDHFGNLITNISELDLSAARSPQRISPSAELGKGHFDVFIGPHHIGPIHSTYADVPFGQPVAVLGSSRMLEVAINSGDAAKTLGVQRGEAVTVRSDTVSLE